MNNNPFENTVNTFGQNQTEQSYGLGNNNQNQSLSWPQSYGLGSENQTFGQENNNSTQWGLNNTPLTQNNNNTFSNNLFGNNNLFNQNQSVWNKNQYQTQTPSRYNLKDLTDRLQQYQNNALGNSNSSLNSGLNNSSIFSSNNMQSLNLNASSALYPQQNSFSTYYQPYQFAQNSLPNSGSDVVKPRDYKLGTLSGLSESGNDPAAIGKDNAGGPSYGAYQIATYTGTMNKYLNFIKNNPQYKKFYDALERAGGNKAATLKDPIFINEWKALSQNDNFNQSQYNFIINTHLQPLLNSIQNKELLDIENRHPVVKDALHSMSVQHGKAAQIVNNTFKNYKKRILKLMMQLYLGLCIKSAQIM